MNPDPAAIVAIAAGGAAGACLRAALTAAINAAVGRYFAHALAVVNIAGSILLGIIVAGVDPSLRPLLATGLCGAMTTFSTFAHSAIELLRAGRLGRWAVHCILHLAGCTAGVLLGQSLYQ